MKRGCDRKWLDREAALPLWQGRLLQLTFFWGSSMKGALRANEKSVYRSAVVPKPEILRDRRRPLQMELGRQQTQPVTM